MSQRILGISVRDKRTSILYKTKGFAWADAGTIQDSFLIYTKLFIMTRAEKHEKRKTKALNRRIMRMSKYVKKIQAVADLPYGVPLSTALRYSSWSDSNSPTGYSQRCEMGGICQSPCNGDC